MYLPETAEIVTDSLRAWPEGRIIAHVKNKIYMASLWFYPNPPAELPN